MKTYFKGLMWLAIILIAMLGITVVFGIFGGIGSWFGEARQVAQEELGPRALLQKYEWFKDTSAALDEKRATIKSFQTKVDDLETDYEGIHRKDWDRTDKEDSTLWKQEVAGVKASYNGLAGRYNAQMSKMNYRFTNIGMLPEGATEPLPREWKPYIED